MTKTSTSPSGNPLRLLSGLNLFGLDHLDTVLLAALADERPLLLIGPHGTAKSELLNRLAAELKLAHRHYNASLISFDDLLGYPLPNHERTCIEYLRTPGDLWDAESVFLDEISRCRPENQNKLFSVIHERRIQGISLEKLRYRWSAMNPPLTGDEESDDETYSGSIPLDAALADRFPWVVELPRLDSLDRKARLSLIQHGNDQPTPSFSLPVLVKRTRDAIALSGDGAAPAWAASYVDALIGSLSEAGLRISGRRAVFIARGVLSAHASASTLGIEEKLADSAFLALKWGLPQRAQGKKLEESSLLAIHRLAVKTAGEADDSPWHRIRAIADPVQRVAVALQYTPQAISKLEFSTLVIDACASTDLPGRYLLARHLAPRVTEAGLLNVPAFETLSAPLIKLTAFCGEENHSVDVDRRSIGEWNKAIAKVAELEKGQPDDAQLGNLLLTLYAVEKETPNTDAFVARDSTLKSWFSSSAAKD